MYSQQQPVKCTARFCFALASWRADSARLRQALQQASSRNLGPTLQRARWLNSQKRLMAWTAGLVLESPTGERCAHAPSHSLLRPGLLDL